MTLKYNPVGRKKQFFASSIITTTITSTLTTIGIINLTAIINHHHRHHQHPHNQWHQQNNCYHHYVIIITTMASWGSPGTVSGNVSFCIVCIAFRALRARYHLDKNTAAWAECPSRWERERFSISLMGRTRREGFSISHIRLKLKTQDAQYKRCIEFSDGNWECLISNLSPFQCLFICDGLSIA